MKIILNDQTSYVVEVGKIPHGSDGLQPIVVADGKIYAPMFLGGILAMMNGYCDYEEYTGDLTPKGVLRAAKLVPEV